MAPRDPYRFADDVARLMDATLKDVARDLLAVVPASWRRIDLIARMSVAVQELDMGTYLADRSVVHVPAPRVSYGRLAELRKRMYLLGLGTWFSARLTLDPPNHASATYNYHHDPGWTPPFEPAWWVRDLTAFPREPVMIPDWLRAQLGMPSLDEAYGSGGPLTDAQNQQLVSSLTVLLLQTLPSTWSQLFLDVRMVGSVIEMTQSVLNVFGGTTEWKPPDAALALLRELREGMYRKDEGTWTSVKYHLVYPADGGPAFERDREPRWLHRPAAHHLDEEQVKFPRREDRIPDWLRRR